jgi:DNA-binding HxlR family transcriptional regulator
MLQGYFYVVKIWHDKHPRQLSKEGTIVFPHEPPAVDVDAVLLNLSNILRHNTAGPDTAQALAKLQAMVRAMARDGTRREDPMRELFARVGDKWSMLLLHLLRTGSYRHAVLRRLVSAVGIEGRISQRMMTLRLRALERDGLIVREVTSSHPPGVEYALTELGTRLLEQLDGVMQWIRDNLAEIRLARERFESAAAAP